MTVFADKNLKPLPEALPPGEHVLYQCSPGSWQALSRRVFFMNKIAIYMTIILAWVGVNAYLDQGSALAIASAVATTIPAAAAVFLLVFWLGRFYAKTTVYTVTNKRVVIETGLSYTTITNLPFSRIERVDMKAFKDGSADLEIHMAGDRMLYSMLWPSTHQWRWKRPVPMLRAIEDPQQLAGILAHELSNSVVASPAPSEFESENHGQQSAAV
ncbi:MAG: photosynthetic complex putative assembly protein PuhB [Pseudomonadota bacterium]